MYQQQQRQQQKFLLHQHSRRGCHQHGISLFLSAVCYFNMKNPKRRRRIPSHLYRHLKYVYIYRIVICKRSIISTTRLNKQSRAYTRVRARTRAHCTHIRMAHAPGTKEQMKNKGKMKKKKKKKKRHTYTPFISSESIFFYFQRMDEKINVEYAFKFTHALHSSLCVWRAWCGEHFAWEYRLRRNAYGLSVK